MQLELEALEVSVEDAVAEIVMKGPGRGNAMGPAFWEELPTVLDELGDDPEVRVIIIRGAGDQFSWGLDLMSMMSQLAPHMTGEQRAGNRTRLWDMIRELQAAIDAVEDCKKPVIAAVHGWCIGGGVDLITACDIRLCSTDASFSVREVKLAIVADLGSLQRLPHIIGQGNTRELALTGGNVDAERALRMGLVNEVYSSPQALFECAREMAQEIAKNPPLTVQGIKEVLNHSRGRTVEDGLEYVAVWNAAFLQSNDLEEAISAFAEKREPHFTGD
jgi:enoyl-CoA hydratase